MNHRCIVMSILTCAVCCILASQVLLAQSITTGGTTALVSDPSGGVIANTTITRKSVEKGFTQTTTSNVAGAYGFVLLAPRTYSLSTSAGCFKAILETSSSNNQLDVDSRGCPDRHSFGSKAVNNLVASATYYSAIFKNPNGSAALMAFPARLEMGYASLVNSASADSATLGGQDINFPQGAEVQLLTNHGEDRAASQEAALD